MSIGSNIKKTRNKLGWSQNDLATKCSIGRSSIANYEQGIRTPDYDTIEKIACALNVSPQFLCGWEDENGNLLVEAFKDENFMLSHVIEEDIDIIRWAYANKLQNYEYFEMDDEKKCLKGLLNSFGYDLKYDKHGYTMFSNNGAYAISNEDLDNLINSTKVYLEFSANKLINEKYSCNNGILLEPKNGNNK